MWWEFAVYIVLALVVLYLAIFQRVFMKKYWKYILAVIPIVIIAVRILAHIASKKPVPDDSGLRDAVGEVRDSIEEANREAAVRIAAARAKDQAKLDELKKVMAIQDKADRRRRLAQLVG